MFVKYSGFIEKLQHPSPYITHLQESVFNDKYIYMLIAKFAVGKNRKSGCISRIGTEMEIS